MDEIREGVKNGSIRSIGFFVGPEGGFEADEVEQLTAVGARIISLGNRILRTETAGIALLSVLGFMLDS